MLRLGFCVNTRKKLLELRLCAGVLRATTRIAPTVPSCISPCSYVCVCVLLFVCVLFVRACVYVCLCVYVCVCVCACELYMWCYLV